MKRNGTHKRPSRPTRDEEVFELLHAVKDFTAQDPFFGSRMILCSICGNKRCPHAADHRHECTNSNEPGQPGSSYE